LFESLAMNAKIRHSPPIMPVMSKNAPNRVLLLSSVSTYIIASAVPMGIKSNPVAAANSDASIPIFIALLIFLGLDYPTLGRRAFYISTNTETCPKIINIAKEPFMR
jgi:hypothetical protein